MVGWTPRTFILSTHSVIPSRFPNIFLLWVYLNPVWMTKGSNVPVVMGEISTGEFKSILLCKKLSRRRFQFPPPMFSNIILFFLSFATTSSSSCCPKSFLILPLAPNIYCAIFCFLLAPLPSGSDSLLTDSENWWTVCHPLGSRDEYRQVLEYFVIQSDYNEIRLEN